MRNVLFRYIESLRMDCERRRFPTETSDSRRYVCVRRLHQRTLHEQLPDNGKVLTDTLLCNAASILQSQHLVLSLSGLFSNVDGVKEI